MPAKLTLGSQQLASHMERDVQIVLKEAGLADAAELLRAIGVFNLESMRVMAGVSSVWQNMAGTCNCARIPKLNVVLVSG